MKSLIVWFVGLLFPAQCLGCLAYDTPLCERCMDGIAIRASQECIVCKRQSRHGTPCTSCAAHTMVDRLFIAGSAEHPLLHDAIHALKYRFVTTLARPLAKFLTDSLSHNEFRRETFATNPLIISVPLHARRLAERGFNQSDMLAGHVAASTAMIHARDVIVRIRNTGSQVKSSSRWERLNNMRGAFVCTRPDIVVDRDVVLVDDVCTTGATLDACADALKAAGARTVSAVVLARG